MEDEILNIDYHVKKLVLRAINLHGPTKVAAEKLGITVRTLFHYKKAFNIEQKRIYVSINDKAKFNRRSTQPH